MALCVVLDAVESRKRFAALPAWMPFSQGIHFHHVAATGRACRPPRTLPHHEECLPNAGTRTPLPSASCALGYPCAMSDIRHDIENKAEEAKDSSDDQHLGDAMDEADADSGQGDGTGQGDSANALDDVDLEPPSS